MKYYLDLTPDEIARVCGKSVNTVYSRLHKAEAIIEKAVIKYAEEKKAD